jgi:hypothetical protein
MTNETPAAPATLVPGYIIPGDECFGGTRRPQYVPPVVPAGAEIVIRRTWLRGRFNYLPHYTITINGWSDQYQTRDGVAEARKLAAAQAAQAPGTTVREAFQPRPR